LKEYILKFILILFEDKANIEFLIYKQKIFECLKPILISLYDKIKITIQEYNSTSSFNDKIKIYASHDIVDGENFYSVKLFDISETPVVNIGCCFIFKNLYNMNEVIIWRYTSLFQNFSYFEGLKYFLSSLSLITIKTQPPNTSSFFDLIVVVSNSFELLKKLMKSSFSNIILQILNDQRDIYFYSISIVLHYFCFNWNEIINEEIISITKSVLYFSLFYVKSPSFQKGEISFRLIKLGFYCTKFLLIIGTYKNSSDEHFNLIKSLFKDSGWTECLINIFNALNPFSLSSSKQLPPFLSFLSSVSPSEHTTNILKYTSEIIILVEDENTPEEISNYFKLTNF
jgi:hypothetical protein